MTPNPPFESLKAELDQIAAALRDLAPVLGTYFQALMREGFTRTEALQLVMAWQAAAYSQLPSEDEDG